MSFFISSFFMSFLSLDEPEEELDELEELEEEEELDLDFSALPFATAGVASFFSILSSFFSFLSSFFSFLSSFFSFLSSFFSDFLDSFSSISLYSLSIASWYCCLIWRRRSFPVGVTKSEPRGHS